MTCLASADVIWQGPDCVFVACLSASVILASVVALGAAAPASAAERLRLHYLPSLLALASVTLLGLAINQTTQEVYVADQNGHTVYAFEASGAEDPTHPKLTKEDGSYRLIPSKPPLALPSTTRPARIRETSTSPIPPAKPSTQFDSQGIATAQAPITESDLPHSRDRPVRIPCLPSSTTAASSPPGSPSPPTATSTSPISPTA